eukprot:scaffold20768_cov138-Skeletonema_dohrnii-CCMP3373.AAC.7
MRKRAKTGTHMNNYHAVRGEREEPIQTWTSRQKDFEIAFPRRCRAIVRRYSSKRLFGYNPSVAPPPQNDEAERGSTKFCCACGEKVLNFVLDPGKDNHDVKYPSSHIILRGHQVSVDMDGDGSAHC